jgi:hypothetical protein
MRSSEQEADDAITTRDIAHPAGVAVDQHRLTLLRFVTVDICLSPLCLAQ